jgi:hypothetical protein
MLQTIKGLRRKKTASSVKARVKKKMTIGLLGITSSTLTKKDSKLLMEGLIDLNFRIKAIDEPMEISSPTRVLFQDNKESVDLSENNKKNERDIINSSDVLFFWEMPNDELLKKVLLKGIPLILPANEQIKDFSADQEIGEGFIFEKNTIWQMLSAVICAYENKKFTYDWNCVSKNCKKLGNSL